MNTDNQRILYFTGAVLLTLILVTSGLHAAPRKTPTKPQVHAWYLYLAEGLRP